MTKSKKFTIQKPIVSVSQTSENRSRKFVITKKIAKHGSQAIIVVPRVLEEHLKPGTTCEISIEVLGNFVEEGK
jgi:hypothetical protein